MYAVSAALSRFLAVFLHHLFKQERSRRRRVGDGVGSGGNGGGSVLQAVSNVDSTAALNVLDELMSALYVANPKVYNGVMRKLERLQDE